MYRVITYFEDLQDNSHPYKAGDSFPRDGVSVSKSRIEELSTAKNRRGMALIEWAEDEPQNVSELAETDLSDSAVEISTEPKKTRSRARKTR